MKSVKHGIIFGFSASLTMILVGISYAAWNDVINSGDPLTATAWNDLVTKISELDTFSFNSGNVGIGTVSPSSSLDVRGTDPMIAVGNSGVLGERMELQYDSTNDFGWIRALSTSGAHGTLSLQGDGGNVGIGTTNPNATLDINGNINIRKKNFTANNSDWISLGYNMVQDSGGGTVLVMCSTNYNTSSGRVALYLVRGTHSSTSTIEDVYLGGTRDMFSFRNNNGNLEVRGWDSGVGLATNAACGVISMGNN